MFFRNHHHFSIINVLTVIFYVLLFFVQAETALFDKVPAELFLIIAAITAAGVLFSADYGKCCSDYENCDYSDRTPFWLLMFALLIFALFSNALVGGYLLRQNYSHNISGYLMPGIKADMLKISLTSAVAYILDFFGNDSVVFTIHGTLTKTYKWFAIHGVTTAVVMFISHYCLVNLGKNGAAAPGTSSKSYLQQHGMTCVWLFFVSAAFAINLSTPAGTIGFYYRTPMNIAGFIVNEMVITIASGILSAFMVHCLLLTVAQEIRTGILNNLKNLSLAIAMMHMAASFVTVVGNLDNTHKSPALIMYFVQFYLLFLACFKITFVLINELPVRILSVHSPLSPQTGSSANHQAAASRYSSRFVCHSGRNQGINSYFRTVNIHGDNAFTIYSYGCCKAGRRGVERVCRRFSENQD